MVEKRPFWAPKVMTGIPHILEMKNAIFRNVRVPEKHASHQPARSLAFFSCLRAFDHFLLFHFSSWFLRHFFFCHFPIDSITVQHISKVFSSLQRTGTTQKPLFKTAETQTTANYVSRAPSAASGQKDFLADCNFDISAL